MKPTEITTRIAKAIKENPGANLQELSRATGIAQRTVVYELMRLRALGKIRVDGLFGIAVYTED